MTASTSYINNQAEIEKIRELRPVEQFREKPRLRLIEPQGQIQVYMASYRGSFPLVLSEALRAAGLGSKVLIAQFLKGGVHQGPNGKVNLCKNLNWVRPDLPFQLGHKNIERDSTFFKAKEAINDIWVICKDALLNKKVQRLVLDEVGLAIQLGFLEEDELISALEEGLDSIDVILTGPSIPPKVISMANQVTELRSSK